MFIWACSLTVFAQDTQTSATPANSNEIQTLFHKGTGSYKIPIGYFIELNGAYSHFGRKSLFLPGISMGVILNHHWTIGMTETFIHDRSGYGHHHSENDSTDDRRHRSMLQGSYGGLLLEYTLFPQSKVHLSFPLTIGGGYIARYHQVAPEDSIGSKREWSHHGKSFFVIEPGVKLEINVIKSLRIGLALSYRYSPERNRMITSPDMLNQLTGKLTFRLGKY